MFIERLKFLINKKMMLYHLQREKEDKKTPHLLIGGDNQ